MVSKSLDLSQHEQKNGTDNTGFHREINLDDMKEIPLDDDSHSCHKEVKGETPPDKIKVKRTVGLLGGISLIIGTMIGSGIFASASSVSRHSGSVGLSLIIWAGSGALATLGALCYIELGLMIPTSGGEYSYLMEAFGDIPAFLFVYTSNILLKPASLAAIVLATGDYLVAPFYNCKSEEKIITAKLLSAFFLGK